MRCVVDDFIRGTSAHWEYDSRGYPRVTLAGDVQVVQWDDGYATSTLDMGNTFDTYGHDEYDLMRCFAVAAAWYWEGRLT